MNQLALSEAVYRDKVMGCWLGKNAGGTLGGPLEKIWGNREPFDVSYYLQEIPEGGLPNDDLEIQLIWLKALEERGLGITCRDLAEYWLNHVGYNPDEYGFHKLNLRQGLLPPVSGWYNNPFKHNMGCPIRSEIWACIAPGLPDVALHYAWHDAVCDHAGGESVYGELFNAAVESCAFFVADRDALLDIGLSVIPEDCLTAKAIREARRAHGEGATWLEARNRVMESVFNLNGQYSPINLGYQTVGWLYGRDFGDALCKATNCGWDTDCTAATLGAILGIIHGAQALPERWIAPLGGSFAVTPPPGIVNLDPPKDMQDLTDRTVAIGRQVLARHHDRVRLSEPGSAVKVTAAELVDREAVRRIHDRPQNAITHTLPAVEVEVAYPRSPCISTLQPAEVVLLVRNRGDAPISGRLVLTLPEGYASDAAGNHPFWLEPRGTHTLGPVLIETGDPARVRTANVARVELRLDRRPATETVPVVLMGARKWLVSPVDSGGTLETFERHLEALHGDGPPPGWSVAAWPGNELPVEVLFGGRPGVLGLLHYVWNPEARTVRVSVPNDYRMQLWVNGLERKKTSHPVPCHPSLWGDCDPVLQWDDIHINTCDVALPQGWNRFAIVLERGSEPMRAFLNLSYDMQVLHGGDDLEQTRFPWEVEDPQYAAGRGSTVSSAHV